MMRDHDPPSVTERNEAKLLALTRSQIVDETTVTRQRKLLDETQQTGLRTVEIEASLARWQVIVVERRASLEALLSEQAATPEV